MPKKLCGYCNGFGLYPFCPKCYKPKTHEIQLAVRKQQRSVQTYEDTNRETINRFRERENKKDLANMVRNMLKANMTTTGASDTDRQINELFGEPEEWRVTLQMFVDGLL